MKLTPEHEGIVGLTGQTGPQGDNNPPTCNHLHWVATCRRRKAKNQRAHAATGKPRHKIATFRIGGADVIDKKSGASDKHSSALPDYRQGELKTFGGKNVSKFDPA
jgi:hypothetical protein